MQEAGVQLSQACWDVKLAIYVRPRLSLARPRISLYISTKRKNRRRKNKATKVVDKNVKYLVPLTVQSRELPPIDAHPALECSSETAVSESSDDDIAVDDCLVLDYQLVTKDK